MARRAPLHYTVSGPARRDLRRIWRYIAAEGSAPAAQRVVAEIAERFVLLGNHPHAGRARDEIAPGLRSFPVRDYLILYTVMPPGVQIERIWDNRQDPERLQREMTR